MLHTGWFNRLLRCLPEATCAIALAATSAGALAQDDNESEGPDRFEGHAVVRAEIKTIRDLRTMFAVSPDCWSESEGLGSLDFRIPPDRMAALQKSGVPMRF